MNVFFIEGSVKCLYIFVRNVYETQQRIKIVLYRFEYKIVLVFIDVLV